MSNWNLAVDKAVTIRQGMAGIARYMLPDILAVGGIHPCTGYIFPIFPPSTSFVNTAIILCYWMTFIKSATTSTEVKGCVPFSFPFLS